MPSYQWMDTTVLRETPGIRSRCNEAYISAGLKERFPGEKIEIESVQINSTGCYDNPAHGGAVKLEGLPEYCEISLIHYEQGNRPAKVTVWVPLAWNERFIGTGGGGIQTGGVEHITLPDRGMTVACAVINGFASATSDAGNADNLWALIPETGELNTDALENWYKLGTHWMTLLGKACTAILHGKEPLYAYYHGGSGGGRQGMVEAQEYPEDYDGIWASFPAINWAHCVHCELWPIAVMNEYGNILRPCKLDAFRDVLHKSVGGSERFYKTMEAVSFDPAQIIGQETADGIITEADAKVMREIWDGPVDENGNRLGHFFRPGCTFWSGDMQMPAAVVYISMGSQNGFYYPMFTEYFAQWILRQPGCSLSQIRKEDYYAIHSKSVKTLAAYDASKADLSAFQNAGGKLIVDHGLEDYIIPPDGSIDYYSRVSDVVDNVRDFFRLFISPGFGHGDARFGLAPTEESGMTALMDWVERGVAPEMLSCVQTDAAGNVIRVGQIEAFQED